MKAEIKALQVAIIAYRAAQHLAAQPGADIIDRMGVTLCRKTVQNRIDDIRAARKNQRLQVKVKAYRASIKGEGMQRIMGQITDPMFYRVAAMEKIMYARKNVLVLRRMKMDTVPFLRRALKEINTLRARARLCEGTLWRDVSDKVLVS